MIAHGHRHPGASRVTIAQALAPERHHRRAALIGLGAGVLPDADALIAGARGFAGAYPGPGTTAGRRALCHATHGDRASLGR